MNKILKAHILIILANIIYGINYNIAKTIMPDYVLPFGLTVLRVLGAIVLFWVFDAFCKTEKISKKDFGLLFLCGIFGVAINQLLFLKGLNFTSPIDASIIITSIPILVLIFAGIIIKESFTILKVLGILLGCSGAVMLIIFEGTISFDSESFTGNLLVFVNAASYSLFLVIVKPLMNKYKPVTVMKWVFVFGSLIVVPAGFGELKMISWQDMPVSIWFSIGYVVVATTFLAYFLNITGLQHVSPTTASIYIYLQPVIAAIVSLITGQDTITTFKIIATLLVFAGVYLVSKTGNLPSPHTTADKVSNQSSNDSCRQAGRNVK